MGSRPGATENSGSITPPGSNSDRTPVGVRPSDGAKYRDLVELGSGGMGDVYLSVVQGPAGFSKLLVVKRLRTSLAEDPELLAMFLTEARIAARLNHPNVVQTIEVGFDGSRHFIAMEYLDGQSLQGLIRKATNVGGLPLAMHLRILAESLAGLHYAHELTDLDGKPLGVVHRDATPHNIFLTYDGQVKVVDFGIAKVGDGDRTRTGVLKGKVPYMAPEQIEGTQIDRRADVFAVGAMLWAAATGQRLWKGMGDIQVMARVHSGTVPSPRSVNRLVPERLDEIIMKAMARNREQRYATAADLQHDLEVFIDQLGPRTTARDVGKFATELFSEERVRLKQAVDSQLRALRESAAAATTLSALGLPPGTLSIAAIQTTRANETAPDGIASVSVEPLLPQSVTPQPIHPAAQRSRVGWVLGGAAVVATLIAVVVLRAPRQTDGTSSTTAATDGKTPATGPAVAKAPASVAGAPSGELVELAIDVTPAEAQVYLDDTLVTAAYAARLAKDGASHRIRAEAPGYASKSEWIAFDHTPIKIKWSLERSVIGTKETVGSLGKPTLKGGTTTIATATNGTVTTATATAPTGPIELEKPPAKPKPAKPIDTDDPWK
ncbi:MAG: serine/threonine-protein kinase [Polyangiales bacterium]